MLKIDLYNENRDRNVWQVKKCMQNLKCCRMHLLFNVTAIGSKNSTYIFFYCCCLLCKRRVFLVHCSIGYCIRNLFLLLNLSKHNIQFQLHSGNFICSGCLSVIVNNFIIVDIFKMQISYLYASKSVDLFGACIEVNERVRMLIENKFQGKGMNGDAKGKKYECK